MTAIGVSNLRTALVAAAVLCPSTASADTGAPAKAAIAAAAARPMWTGASQRSDATPGASRTRTTTWERDAEPEERRYTIVASLGRSIEERFEASTRIPGYGLEPASQSDLSRAVSRASFADFRSSRQTAVVRSSKLGVTQRFFRGARFGFIVSRSIAAVRGVRNYGWTEIPLANLAPYLRAFRSCAASGECGE